ncbi:MAG: TRAP transporter substrate-binding protein DctP [Bacillota bacterium]
MRKVGLGVVVLLFAMLMVGIASAQDKVLILKAAYDFPTTSPVHAGMIATAKYLEEETGGKVQLQLFSGTWGTQQDETMALLQGTLDIYHTGATWLAEYYPPLGAIECPFLYRDIDHINKFRQSDVAREVMAGFEANTNLKIINMWYLGLRQTLLATKPARTPEDFKGIKLRVVQMPLYLEVANVLGTSGTPIPIHDVYMALKTGIVDGTENPLAQIDTMKFYEVAKYLVLTGHMVSYTMPVINKASWNKVPKQYQPVLIEAFNKGLEVNDKLNLEAEATLIQKFKERGIIVIEPDREAFRKRASYLKEKYAKQWGDLYDRIAAIK